MKKAWVIALNTFQESLRKKTFYVLLVVALIVIGASRFFSFLAAEDELKMIKDVGFASIEFFGALIAIFTALTAVSGEIEKRTIYPLLSKPIKRSHFIIGKLTGQTLVIFLNFVFMSLFFIVLLLIKKSPPDINIFKALILIFIELVLIGTITLTVATFATEAFNLIFSFFLYVVGHLISYGSQILERVENTLLQRLGKAFYSILPNYENFNIKDKVVVGVSVSWKYVGTNVLYGILYMVIALLIGIYFFNKREV